MMPDPFAVALVALFNGPGAVAITYTSDADDTAISIRAIRDQQTRQAEFGASSLLFDTDSFMIQKADVDRPQPGDRIALADSSQFRLVEGARLDVEGITWTCPVEPA